jgi:hypothetical protein
MMRRSNSGRFWVHLGVAPRGKRVRIEPMGALDPTGIAWSLTTRSGALARAKARGHQFDGGWTDRVSEVDSMQHPYSVTHCLRCGAALFAEFVRVEKETNPAIDGDCAEAGVNSRQTSQSTPEQPPF